MERKRSKTAGRPVPESKADDGRGRTEMIMGQKDKRYIVSTRQQQDAKM